MKDWTMVRITRATRARLEALLESQQRREDNGGPSMPESGKPGGGPPSVDWLVNLALDRIDGHKARAAKQRAKKRGFLVPPSDDGKQDVVEDVIVVVEDGQEMPRCQTCNTVHRTMDYDRRKENATYRCTGCGLISIRHCTDRSY